MAAPQLRPSWADDPVVVLPCQEPGVHPDVFHPTTSGEAAKAALKLARRYCTRCPLQAECLEFGLASNETGIWGGRRLDGMSARDKRDLLARTRERRTA